jgi:hypothetical protein
LAAGVALRGDAAAAGARGARAGGRRSRRAGVTLVSTARPQRQPIE